ncbi:MAG: hypothetical protein NTZ21_13115 [Actinobacteria bacterium]|nr:hypothetical protein [Actinomycetota bacterium]
MDDRPLRVLFQASPAAYVEARSTLAKQVRSVGDKELAKLVQGLKRPTLAMWAVVAAADDAESVRGLVDSTEALAAAQGSGDREATVSATARRRGALEGVVRAAVERLAPWEPSAEARRAEIRTIVDQLSRHGELLDPWIDGTLRELPEADAFGFAAFTGMEAPAPRKEPAPRRLRSVPDLPREDDGDARERERAAAAERRERERAEREARAARAVAARETRREVDAALKALAAAQRKVTGAEEAVAAAETLLRAAEADRDDAAARHADASARLAALTDD